MEFFKVFEMIFALSLSLKVQFYYENLYRKPRIYSNCAGSVRAYETPLTAGPRRSRSGMRSDPQPVVDVRWEDFIKEKNKTKCAHSGDSTFTPAVNERGNCGQMRESELGAFGVAFVGHSALWHRCCC